MNKKAIANFLVRANAFSPFRFLNRNKLPVLMYHRFSESEEFGRTSRTTFERQMEYIARRYTVVSLKDAVDRLKSGEMLPTRSAVLTIDDGYSDAYEIAFPVLKKFGLPATLYVVTDYLDGECWIWTDLARYILSNTSKKFLWADVYGVDIEIALTDKDSRLVAAGQINSQLKKIGDKEKDDFLRVLAEQMRVNVPAAPSPDYSGISWDQAREMSATVIEIGSHTSTHPILTNVDDTRCRNELERSLSRIREMLQQEKVHFCYPNGNVSAREQDLAIDVGYESAVTTELRLCDKNDKPFLIPRIDAEPEMHRFVQSTSGFDAIRSR